MATSERLLSEDETRSLLKKAKAKKRRRKRITGSSFYDWEPESDPLHDAIEKELRLRHQLRAAQKNGRKRDQGDICREWWGAMEALLEQTAQAFRPSKGALIQLSQLAGYLAVGTISPLIELARSRGNRKAGPRKRSHLGWAVAYVRAAKEGRVADARHTKTIAKSFGVTERTVQKWAAHIAPPSGSKDMRGEQIKEEMENAARAYPGHSKKTMARKVGRERE